MWTRASRGRMAGFEKRSKCYPTELTDEEWLFIQPFLLPVPTRERKPATDLRDVLDALLYLARMGGGWRCCRTTSRPGKRSIGGSGDLFAGCCSPRCRANAQRERENREQSPTAAVIDTRASRRWPNLLYRPVLTPSMKRQIPPSGRRHSEGQG